MKKRGDVGNLAYLLYRGAEQVLSLLEGLLTDADSWQDVYSFVDEVCPEKKSVAVDVAKRLNRVHSIGRTN